MTQPTSEERPSGHFNWMTDPRIQRMASASTRTIAARVLEADALCVDPATLKIGHRTAVFDIEGIIKSSTLPPLVILKEVTTRVERILGKGYSLRLSLRDHAHLHVHLTEKG